MSHVLQNMRVRQRPDTAGTIYRRITSEAAAHLQIRRAVLVLLTMSMVLNLLLAAYLLTKEDQSRTVVIAPDAGEPYIAMNEKVSANLLERFSVSALGLVLNMSPETSRSQTEAFLKYVAPESYAAMAANLRRTASSLERNQAATAFFAQAATVDAKRLATCISGLRRTMIGRAVTDEANVSACLRLEVRMGRLWIVELDVTETGRDDRAPGDALLDAFASGRGMKAAVTSQSQTGEGSARKGER